MDELIWKEDVINTVEEVDWYHINERGELVKGANSKDHEPLYKTKDIYEALENLPTVQPQRMKGRWLPDNNFAYEMRFVCSVCKESEVVPTIGFTKYKPIWDFCPNCGADMRGEQESE